MSGSLVLANASGVALSGTTSLAVNAAAGVTLGANNQINDAATVTLGGGTFATGGFSEGTAIASGVGAATLSGNSIIDLGAGASLLAFADSSAAAWSGTSLKIFNWSGSTSGGGTDKLYFGTTAAGLTAAQLATITFYSDAGTTLLGGAKQLSTGEVVANVVAAPEPATLGVLGAAASLLLRRRRRATVA